MTVTCGLIRVYLACNHWFEAGYLNSVEKRFGEAYCHKCKTQRRITQVVKGDSIIPLKEALA